MARCCRPRLGAPGTPGRQAEALPLERYCDSLDAVLGAEDAMPMLFPMYVVRVPSLLKMKEALPHQTLKAAGIVEEYHRSMGVAAFVSHQWCSLSHPDPSGAQLAVLQGMLRRLASGNVHLQVSFPSWFVFRTKPTVRLADLRPMATGCIWYDYFAVPQPSMNARYAGQHASMQQDIEEAVFSIPAYVETCQFFFVLAPPLTHADFPESTVDYRSWKDRGWCRLERFARRMSPSSRRHLLLITGEDTLSEMGCEDMLPVGEGSFSIEGDRTRLAPVMVAMLEQKLRGLLRHRDLHEYRRFLCFRPHMLRGFPGVSPKQVVAPGFDAAASGRPLEDFLRVYGLRSGQDRAGGKTEPIFFAAREGDLEAVRALLDGRADVDAKEGASDPNFVWVRGATPLHFASVSAPDPAVPALLLARRANIAATNCRGVPVLMSAVCAGRREIVALLLAHRADVDFRLPNGMTALHAAAAFGMAGSCAQLLEARASAAPSREGLSPLFLAVLLNGGRSTVEALLTAPDAGLDTAFAPRRFSPLAALLATLALRGRLRGPRDHLARLASEIAGMTPLIAAGFVGSIGEARALMEAGADPTARNVRGRTAADLAKLSGLLPSAIMYLQDPDARVAWELERLQGMAEKLSAQLAAMEAMSTSLDLPSGTGPSPSEAAVGAGPQLLTWSSERCTALASRDVIAL